jgi:hypothetical protein
MVVESCELRPFWSRRVAWALAAIGVGLAVGVVGSSTYEARIRFEGVTGKSSASYELDEGGLLGGDRLAGAIEVRYGRATVEPAACTIVLSEPQLWSKNDGLVVTDALLPVFGAPLPAPRVSLALTRCDEALHRELGRVASRLESWMTSDASEAFVAVVGSHARSARWDWGLAIALAFAGAVASMAAFRVRIERDHVAGASAPRLRVVRSFGPLRRAVAEIVGSEVTDAKLRARSVGPLVAYCPVLALVDGREIMLWPFAGYRVGSALEARDRVRAWLDGVAASRANAAGVDGYR